MEQLVGKQYHLKAVRKIEGQKEENDSLQRETVCEHKPVFGSELILRASYAVQRGSEPTGGLRSFGLNFENIHRYYYISTCISSTL